MKLCEIDGCTNQHFGRGFCNRHYQLFRLWGKPNPTKAEKQEIRRSHKKKCEYCDDLGGASGLCRLHLKRRNMGRNMTMPRKINNVGNPGYSVMHDKIKKLRGNARDHTCINCSSQGHDWCLLSTGRIIVQETGPHAGRLFSRDVMDYAPMCRSCHVTNDFALGLHR